MPFRNEVEWGVVDIDDCMRGASDGRIPGGAAAATASQDASELTRGLLELHREVQTCQSSSNALFQSVLANLVALHGIASRCESPKVSTCPAPPHSARPWVTKAQQCGAENLSCTQNTNTSLMTEERKPDQLGVVKWDPVADQDLTGSSALGNKSAFLTPRTLSTTTDTLGQDIPIKLRELWWNLLRASDVESNPQGGCISELRSVRIHTMASNPGKFWRPVLSPNSKSFISWNILGIACLLYDAFTIPIELAWGEKVFDSSGNHVVLFACAIYWTLCMALTMNTGFFDNCDQLVTSRWKILKHYAHTWMTFDVILLLNDWAQLFIGTMDQLKALRAARAIRVSRLFRLIKFRQLEKVIEEASFAKGRTAVMFSVVIAKMLFGILFSAHVGASLWYFIGTLSQERGAKSWLDECGLLHASPPNQYLLGFHWVLAHITSAPAGVHPGNSSERLFAVGVALFICLIVGYCLTKMLSCVNELENMTAERRTIKRELRQYLIANHIPLELATRSMRFLLFALERRSSSCPDPRALGLLSEQLRFDLIVARHGPIIRSHPLLSLLSETQRGVQRDLCKVLMRHTHDQEESVFVQGLQAHAAHVTVHGLYRLWSGSASAGTTTGLEFSSQEWFSDLCLFTKFMHRSTLTAVTYADSHSLSLDDFVACVKNSPGSIAVVVEYAQAYLDGVCNRVGDAELTNRVVAHDQLPPQLGKAARAMTKLHKLQDEEDALARSGFKSREWFRTSKLVDKVMEAQKAPQEQLDDVLEPLDFVKAALDGSKLFDCFWGDGCAELSTPHGVDWLEKNLGSTFREIHPTKGIYMALDHDTERRRALASTLCALHLLRDCYDDFVESQPPAGRMSEELWKEIQAFVNWTNMTPESIHTALVFLAIRGLGKASSFADICPETIKDSAEQILLYGIDHVPDLVPSVGYLSEDMADLLKRTTRLNEQFNFAQMLQGENNPCSVGLLKQYVEEFGNQALKFYMFCLVGMMCGLLGNASTKGSKFMTDSNARNVLFAIKSLQQLESASPVHVYWGYIIQRANHLQLPARSQEELAFVRFACLNRVIDHASLEPVKSSWNQLDKDDRQRLVQHLRADGIDQQAVILTFLPLYLENARNNNNIGLDLALGVLIEFLDMLYETLLRRKMDASTIIINASNLAEYARQVVDHRAFVASPESATLVCTKDSAFRIKMSQMSWQMVREQCNVDNGTLMLSRQVNHILVKQSRAEQNIGKVLADYSPCVHPI